MSEARTAIRSATGGGPEFDPTLQFVLFLGLFLGLTLLQLIRLIGWIAAATL